MSQKPWPLQSPGQRRSLQSSDVKSAWHWHAPRTHSPWPLQPPGQAARAQSAPSQPSSQRQLHVSGEKVPWPLQWRLGPAGERKSVGGGQGPGGGHGGGHAGGGAGPALLIPWRREGRRRRSGVRPFQPGPDSDGNLQTFPPLCLKKPPAPSPPHARSLGNKPKLKPGKVDPQQLQSSPEVVGARGGRRGKPGSPL